MLAVQINGIHAHTISTDQKGLTIVNTKQPNSEGNNGIIINIAPPSTQGHSTNTFNKFTTSASKYTHIFLNNDNRLNKKLSTSTQAVNTIILQNTSSTPMSFSTLEVMGKKATVVILSPSGINCNGCEIKNAERVVLATGTKILNKTGDLSKININRGTFTLTGLGLKTWDAGLIDILAEHVVFSGPISTFAKASKKQGNLVIDELGNLTMAQGDLQVIIGKTSYDLATSQAKVNQLNANAASIKVNSPIQAGSISIETMTNYKSIFLNSNLSTRGDYTFTSNYKGKSLIPNENIKIKSRDGIYLQNASINSRAKVKLDSQVLSIRPTYNFKKFSIESHDIELATTGYFLNEGAIKANNIHVSAQGVSNQGGEFWATDELFIAAERSEINNHFGIRNIDEGLMVSHNISLVAKGSIENGQRTAYSCYRNQPRHGGNRTYSVGSTIIGIETQLKGTCKKYGYHSARSKWHISKTHNPLAATIVATNLLIDTKAQFVNSNPYIKYRPNYKAPTVDMLIYHSDHATVSAESSMQISATRINNQSGVLEVLNGDLTLDVSKNGVIFNGRYHMHAKTHTSKSAPYPVYGPSTYNKEKCIDANAELDSYDDEDPSLYSQLVRDEKRYCYHTKPYLHDAVDTNHTQYIAALSPVSRILVGGNLRMTAKEVMNEASNIEVWGNMQGSVTDAYNKGLKLNHTLMVKATTKHVRHYCSKRVLSMCVKRKTDRWTTSSEKLVRNGAHKEFPSLYHANRIESGVNGGKFELIDHTF